MLVGNMLRAFHDEITGETDTFIAVVKFSCVRMVGRLLFAYMIAITSFCSADAANDIESATRAQLERIESLRKQRPGDGVLVFYEASTRIALGDREAAFALLRTLQGRKMGLVPVRDT